MDERVNQSLWENSKYFIGALGEPCRESHALNFPLKKELPFASFRIRYGVENKFLGKIYVMLLEGKFAGTRGCNGSESIELRYSGFLKKGTPSFVPVSAKGGKGKEDAILRLLNENQTLIERCWKLDIESLKLSFDPADRVWTLLLRPFGGSYIYVMFPPMRYNVILVRDQADLLLSVMEQIARLLGNF
jgi:hypothetical protein